MNDANGDFLWLAVSRTGNVCSRQVGNLSERPGRETGILNLGKAGRLRTCSYVRSGDQINSPLVSVTCCLAATAPPHRICTLFPGAKNVS